MSYCLNPDCSNPQNPPQSVVCQTCGSHLLLRDRYRISQPLGQGGFGATFLAIDESLPGHPNCVIKQLRPSATAPHILQMAQDLFEREAQTLGRIGNHPQVPRLLDYFIEAKTTPQASGENREFYLVQEYVSGATLQQEIKRSGPISEAGVKHFLSEILPVLDYIHTHRVIHRDIKPANVIRRDQDDRLVLIDFGAVKYQTQQPASEHTALTAYAIGTPGFAPPEQMAMRPVPASDIYALGVTCIYLLTGKSPKDLDYDPTTGELLWQKHVHISDHFVTVLRKMLEVSVRHRYQSATEIFRALDLEPYLDSLQNSLISAKTAQETSKRRLDYRDSAIAAEPASPAARAAMAIRARQTRLDSSGSGSNGSRGRLLAARMGSSGGLRSRDSANSGGLRGQDVTSGGMRSRGSMGQDKPQPPVRLDAEGVQNYYIKGRRDFASQDLHALPLQKVNLSSATFHNSNLSQINLQGANLFNADFGKANLNRANLRDANLARAYLSNADLEGADLRGADLSSAYLVNANLRGANLCGANLTGAKLTEEQLAMARTNWMTIRPSGRRGMW